MALNDEEQNRIEELKKKLYSNTPMTDGIHRGRLHQSRYNVESDWKAVPIVKNDSLLEERETRSNTSIFKKVLIFAIVFFILSLGIAAYMFFKGTNVVSANNIDIGVLGPVSSPAGDVLSLDMSVTNRNDSNLELVDLVIDYPPGTRSPTDLTSPVTSERVPIGTILSGQTVKQTVKTVLFGEENSQQDIKVSVEYRIANSNAIFTKEKDYPIFIGTSPISMTISSLKQINTNQNLELDVHLVSNSTTIVKGVLLNVDYPFGFVFSTSTPVALLNNQTWKLGDIEPGGVRDIKIIGTVTGQNGDDRVFNFSAGTADPNDDNKIGTVFVTSAQDVAITQPFLGSDLTFDGDSSDNHVINTGDHVKGEVFYQNNLSTPIDDAKITLKLNGDILDESSVLPDRGFYQSSDNTITWDANSFPDLAEIAPGQSGTIGFEFSTKDPTLDINSTTRKPSISFDLSVAGNRPSDTDVPEQITSSVSKKVIVASDVGITAQNVRTTGPFQNTGPIPPKVNVPSTYTIIWTATNSFNDLGSTQVSATLPSYVTWLGQVSPTTENVTYNKDTKKITWNIGTLPAGTGFAGSPRQVAFQVSFLPSVSQVGVAPIILNATTISGNDTFTNTVITNSNDALDTGITTDPTYQFGDDKVTQ